MDPDYGFGNGYPFPAGPRRESRDTSLARADALILIGDCQPELPVHGNPGFRARMIPAEMTALRGVAVIAFSGIGRPEKFFRSLTESGASIRARYSFADHHPFTRREIEQLISIAASEKAVLVTTEKDHVRIPADLRDRVQVLTVRLQWENNSDLLDMIVQANV